MSLAVGETHGNDEPRRFTNPEGVEFGLAPSPWVSPTANDVVPLRGTLVIQGRPGQQVDRATRKPTCTTTRGSLQEARLPALEVNCEAPFDNL